MKIWLDEHIDPVVAGILEAREFDVSVSEEERGKPDDFHFERALEQDFAIVTMDDDFLKLASERDAPAIIKVGSYYEPSKIADLIEEELRRLEQEEMENSVIYI
ncbi:MAG: DUF5615 family PIN-like protein [Candidatus Aenigmatarchaeota archaeon]